MKKILILGGTQFIGRNLVERLIAIDEFDITLFNRQQTQIDLFPEIKKIKGDRGTDEIKQIKKENWDFVIDLSCYYPNWLKSTIINLNVNLEKYIFISTCSVYDNKLNPAPIKDEQTKTQTCSSSQLTDKSIESYSNRKAECERILKNSNLDYLIFRPSVVYGKYDYTDRFYYWIYQVKYKKALLLPDSGKRQFSLTYVSDLVDSIVKALSKNIKNNTYNVVSNPKTNINEVIEYATEILNSKNELINAKPEFLKKNKVSQWFDMPFWLDGDFFTHSNHKYINDFELEPTELKKSIEETIKYYENLGWKEPKYGMTEKRRMELLEKINKKTTANNVYN
ncbi:MAG: NAD-dependent epimerase/dehydratase family protein [Crocinitomicaceae bacterium]